MFMRRVSELFDGLGESKVMYLGTCSNGRVTSRAMSFIIYDKKLYFQTDRNFIKYEQISENPNVAVCIDNIQIEGVCRDIGAPLDDANRLFAEKYMKYYKSSFEKYSCMKDEALMEVTPTQIKLWNYEDGQPYQEFLNFIDKMYLKEYYKCSK